MRLGIRAKQIAGVTAIVGLSVVALSGLAVERICRFLLEESRIDRSPGSSRSPAYGSAARGTRSRAR